MKRLPIIPAGLLLTILGDWSAAAPVLPAGRPKESASFKSHRYQVNDVAFSPDGKFLVSCGSDGKVKLWDVVSGKTLLDIQACSPDERHGLLGSTESVAFSPDGKTLASCGDDRTIKFWDVATGKKTESFRVGLAPPLLFNPDGKTLVCGYRQLDLATKKDCPLVEKPEMWPVAVFTPKEELLVGMSVPYHPDPARFTVWDVKTGKKIFTRKSDRRLLMCNAIRPDGKMVASSEGDYDTRRWVIRLWDITSGKNTVTHEQPEIPCHPMIFSPDGKVLAVSCRLRPDHNDDPGSIRLFEVSSGKVLATLKGYKRVVNCMVFSPDGRLLATGSLDGIIKIWSLPKRYKAE